MSNNRARGKQERRGWEPAEPNTTLEVVVKVERMSNIIF